MKSGMDSLVSEYGGMEGLLSGYTKPLSDVFETDTFFVVQVELAGVPKEDVVVELEGGVLEVKATRVSSSDYKASEYVRKERQFGKLKRRFVLPIQFPSSVNINDVKAQFMNGLLTVEIPKPKTNVPHQKKRIMLY